MSRLCKSPPRRPGRGRPVVLAAEARRERIMDALEHVYQSAGFDGVTMDAIARQAGMSKRTVYASFVDRSALLRAYLDRLIEAGGAAPAAAACDVPLEARLRCLLIPCPLAPGYALPLGIMRLLIADSAAQPEIGRDFVCRVLDRKRALVLTALQEAQARGELDLPDVAEATDLLLDMLRPFVLETLLDIDRLPSPARIERRFCLTMQVFSRAFAPGSGSAAPDPG